ncbi:beta-1,3-galactosyltransferase 5-like [Uloborus diversus]|uniref:beta-1,3-galactosyltransferase 5-like n=1 Tax=Uloborus diversus TaxID=327109 RepID=UPI0024090BD5|nr:beta-1,3-galactosyltransferase 5-like [Uloborus diversus]
MRRLISINNLLNQRALQGHMLMHYLKTLKNETTMEPKEMANLNHSVEVLSVATKTPIWHIEDLFEEQPHCSSKPFLLVLVATAPENFERRNAIRKTWAGSERQKHWITRTHAKTVFLIGLSTTKFLNVLTQNENEQYGDVLLGSYVDTYRNLTAKVMHGFTWAFKQCKPMFLLKTDDDCFVNLHLLTEFLRKYNPIRTNLYAGRIRWSAPVIRDPTSRWYVSDKEYRGSRYAPYVSGAGYVMSLDVLHKLVQLSGKVDVFPNEDAYVGYVLNFARVRPTYSARFVTHNGPWQVCNFLYLFVVHHVKPSRQKEFQDMVDLARQKCPESDVARDWV